jgi:FADH2 O2-dependent halogenase
MPPLKKQFADAKTTRPFTLMPRVSFRSSAIAGQRWAMLPSAAGFVDPLLSTGFPLTLLGVSRLAELIERDWDTPQFAGKLQAYATQTDNELLAAGHLIASLYATMNRFPLFVSLSMLYFAAASFSEAARRLNKAHLSPSFLLHDDKHFGPAILRCFEHAQTARTSSEIQKLAQEVAQAIEPINIAGLADPQRKNWYPVDAKDLLNSAGKLKATEEEVDALLVRSGFYKIAKRS